MNYVFGNDQEHNGYLDVFDSDHDPECVNIGETIGNHIDKSCVKFNHIKQQYDETMNSEADNHDDCKNFNYENTNEDVLSPDHDIEPLSLFADNKSEVDSVLNLGHGRNKATYHLFKHFKTKETCNDSGKVVHPKNIPNEKNINDPLLNELTNQNTNADIPSKKTRKTRPVNKELTTTLKRSRKFGYSRWGRKEDAQMFSLLRQLCKQEYFNIEDFYTDYFNLSTQHNFILTNLAFQMNWRGDTQSLFKRIQSLGRDQSLSIRQIYDLKRLKKKAIKQKKEFTLEDVVDSFPGKSISTLQSALEKNPSRFYRISKRNRISTYLL